MKKVKKMCSIKNGCECDLKVQISAFVVGCPSRLYLRNISTAEWTCIVAMNP